LELIAMSQSPHTTITTPNDLDRARFGTGIGGGKLLEHTHRYLVARELVVGQDVLVIACAEGSGSLLLAEYARTVVGVDFDQDTVLQAESRYGRDRLQFRVGTCSSLPLPDQSVDVVVGFEALEYCDEQDRLMDEIKRVLRPKGVLVLSCRESDRSTVATGTSDNLDVKELDRSAFEALIRKYFRSSVFYGQRVACGSVIFGENQPTRITSFDANTMHRTEGVRRPTCLIAVASDSAHPVLLESGLAEEDVLNSEPVEGHIPALNTQPDKVEAAAALEPEAHGPTVERLPTHGLKHTLGAARRALRGLFGADVTTKAEPEIRSHTTAASEGPTIDLLFPIGHFYSPIADPVDIASRRAQIFKAKDGSVGIDYRIDAQLDLLEKLAPHVADIRYPVADPGDGLTYFYGNDQYPVLDAEFLHSALCHFRPKHMIEIGSGFSSLVTANVNRSYLRGGLDFTCVEPYPRQFLRDGVAGITNLVISKVEDLDLSFFDRLGAGDILFIDSSHVSKVGSDVNYLFFEVIPRLRSGVMVHVHDIFLPDDYPEQWALHQNRNWNEQYVLHAFLQFNSQWEVLWAAHLMGTRHREAVSKVFPRYPSLGGGGSFWFRRL
jgi:SAM-dependent methyltransferase